jgi:hypothetical protein
MLNRHHHRLGYMTVTVASTAVAQHVHGSSAQQVHQSPCALNATDMPSPRQPCRQKQLAMTTPPEPPAGPGHSSGVRNHRPAHSFETKGPVTPPKLPGSATAGYLAVGMHACANSGRCALACCLRCGCMRPGLLPV